MNKKGFTLIEIIVCIVIVVAVGTVSFFGIRTITKNIRVNKLKDIEDEILTAARIYMETDNKTYQQLYKENNSVILPLNVLVNEGLLDLTYTDLDIDDIKDEYVITALASNNGNNEDCVNITEGSWNLSSTTPIYICTNTSTGNTNLSIINPSSVTNATKVMKEPYIYSGLNPNNYIKLKDNDKVYRIYYVDIDDSLVLTSHESFGTVFVNVLPLCGITVKGVSDGGTPVNNYEDVFWEYIDTSYGRSKRPVIFSNIDYYRYDLNENCTDKSTKEKLIDAYDVVNTYSDDENKSLGLISLSTTLSKSFLGKYFLNQNTYTPTGIFRSGISPQTAVVSWGFTGNFYGFKLHLKPCMKITGGTGNQANPFILEDKC